MNIRKIAMGLAVAGAMALAAGSAHAQQFAYSTTVNPTTILTTDGTGQLAFTGSGGTQSAVAPTQITLTNITETSVNPGFPVLGPSPIPSTPVTINLTFASLSPPGGPGTSNIPGSGTITGSFSFNQSMLNYTFNTTGPVVFDFGAAGVYTLSDFHFVAPGPNSTIPNNIGAINAQVTYAPTPEPGTVAAFALTGLGVLGLMVRARKVRFNGGLAA